LSANTAATTAGTGTIKIAVCWTLSAPETFDAAAAAAAAAEAAAAENVSPAAADSVGTASSGTSDSHHPKDEVSSLSDEPVAIVPAGPDATATTTAS